MEQQPNVVSVQDKTYHLIRLVFYIISGIVAGLQLYIIAALFFVQISCRAYNSTLHQIVERAVFLGGLLILPLFFYTVVASATRKRWWHLGTVVAVFLILGIGLYLFVAKSIFYCFLDDMPKMFFYVGPH